MPHKKRPDDYDGDFPDISPLQPQSAPQDRQTGDEEPKADSDTGSSAGPQQDQEVDMSAHRHADMSTSDEESDDELLRQLSVLIEEPIELPERKPELPRKANAYLSEFADDKLDLAAAILKHRYTSGFSKSLVIDYAIRIALRDLMENGKSSALVRWLDRIVKP